MRSESATVNGRSFLRPRAVFLFRHTSRLGGTWRGDVLSLGDGLRPCARKKEREGCTTYR